MMKSDLQYVALIEMQMFRFFGVILDLGEKITATVYRDNRIMDFCMILHVFLFSITSAYNYSCLFFTYCTETFPSKMPDLKETKRPKGGA